MMNIHQTGIPVTQCRKKVKCLAAFTFFLCAVAPLSSLAASNIVTGTAYGTDDWSTAILITSQSDGKGSLEILHTGTSEINLSHVIEGAVEIANTFSNFNISASGSSLTGQGSPALTVTGGTNLSLIGGQFSVTQISAGGGPPLPPSSANNIAVKISGTQQTTITGTTITGGTESNIGGSALYIKDGALAITGDSVLTGGQGSEAILASNADLQITNGTFSAGAGGSALILISGSTATIHDGTFNSETNMATFLLQNSDLSLINGNVTNGTFISNVDEAKTSTVALHDGGFDWLFFHMDTNGTQYFTAGSNLTVNTGLFQSGGNMTVSNLVADTFKTVKLSNGASVNFSNDFILPSSGIFELVSGKEQASFSLLNIESNATLNVGTGLISADYFTAESYSSNRLSITSNTNGLINAHTALFKTNSILVINTENIGSSSLETNEYTLISADAGQLFAGNTNGVADTTSFTNTVTVKNQDPEGRMEAAGFEVVTLNGTSSVKIGYTAMPLAEYWNLTNGTSTVVTEPFANEIDQPAHSGMLAMIDRYQSSAGSLAAIEQTYFGGMNTFQTSLLGLQTAMGMAPARGAVFREELKLIPTGAKGPERNNNIRGWGKYYGNFLSHDAEGFNTSYDTILHGGVFGIDTSFGNLLVGLSGGAGDYSTTTANEAEENITASHGALYSTYGGEKLWFDAAIAFGFNQVETITAEPFVLEGEFDARLANIYFGGGYDLINTKSGTVFTPVASLQYTYYEQDAYTETSTGALPRVMDAAEADSLRSSIGLDVSMLNRIDFKHVGVKLDGRAHWLHEFNPDPDTITFQLEGGTGDYQLAPPTLEEDLFRAGFGLSFFNAQRHKPKNVMFRIDFDELFGKDFNSHNLSAKVVWVF